MTGLHAIRILNDGPTSQGTRVFIDEKEISGIESITFKAEVDAIGIVTIRMQIGKIEIRSQNVILEEELREITDLSSENRTWQRVRPSACVHGVVLSEHCSDCSLAAARRTADV